MSGFSDFFRKAWLNKAAVTLFDSLVGAACMYAVIHVRYAFEERPIPSSIDETATIVFFFTCILTWVLTDTNRAIWRFTSLDDIKKLLQAVVLATVTAPLILFFFFNRAVDFPRSVPFVLGPLFFFALTLCRMTVVFLRSRDVRAIFRRPEKGRPNAILLGTEGSLDDYLRDMMRREDGPSYNIRGLFGTDESYKGRSIRGVPVLGSLENIKTIYPEIRAQYDDPPTLISTDDMLDRNASYKIVREASGLGAPLVRVSHSRTDQLTSFEAADLIGRKVKTLDIKPVVRFIKGQRVMITGAGGTIGSEITRQVAALEPEKLILVDSSEYNLYEIDRELKKTLPETEHKRWFPYIANICNKTRMERIFKREQPHIILHAAAMKHVPLSEQNPVQALRTNLGGTQNVLDLAIEHKARSFTLISTDKAVSPSNIMGASKRLAEMLTMAHENNDAKMSACAVRFGNVLGSTGSVVPLFEEQIANGGPVTVTHQDVSRYFMTTEEAASLVLQAAALNASERTDLASIYVLEMGEPVKIAHLARQLIRLRGKVPDRDIEIVFTGLRPGEKICEEITGLKENLETTYVTGIQRFTGRMSDPDYVHEQIDLMLESLRTRDVKSIQAVMQTLIPDYDPREILALPKPETPSAEIISLTEKTRPKKTP